ncbi:MAG: 2-oxoacid:acceptor oxidoreductase subunit alpha [Proteobacteria bacterium]|nr:2-oxoacid:acceptor oxidoreductase subunit alpha [Pseudomonadota bacterium]
MVERKELSRVTIRFSGDSGDGMQLAGTHFTNTSALIGNDVSSLPAFPAEIRAPAGSVPGVSSFQISFANEDIFTPGDQPDVLVAMNPAALAANLQDLPRGATIIVNSDEFHAASLKKASYAVSPLEDGSLAGFRVFEVPITSMNERTLAETGLTSQEVVRCKNFFALGLMYWLFNRPTEPTLRLIAEKFGRRQDLANANQLALKAGHAFGETAEMFSEHYVVRPANLEPGTYRNITGNSAIALGCLAVSQITGLPLFYGSYPITPASEILHELSRFKQFGVKTFQAEDEIAAIGSTIGAAFGGALGLTGTSGPGFALKGEALGMAVMTELPLVVVNVQRAGPSTGMPTRTEQADLLQAMFGRNGESPVAVVAPATPADCFNMAVEAFRIALRHMTPVVLLSDGYLANGSEPWRIPNAADLPRIDVQHAEARPGEVFRPYARDPESLARPWAVPGTPGLEHRLGTLEKEDGSGKVSYDGENHHRMVLLRAEKIARIAQDVPPQEVWGAEEGRVLVLGWGSTFGALRSAVQRHRREGRSVSHAHLRYLNPFPANLGQILGRFERVWLPEINLGQLALLLRARFLVDVRGYNRVAGRPFGINEIYEQIGQLYDAAPSPQVR